MNESHKSSRLLQRLSDAATKYASHHRVRYERETLRAITFMATALPYVGGDAYETALDLLDGTGAEIRIKKLVNTDNEIPAIGLRELGPVVARKTGRSLGDFIQ